MTKKEYFTCSFCPQCGWNVKVDEDGCCVNCGCEAVGEEVEKLDKILHDYQQKVDELDKKFVDTIEYLKKAKLENEELKKQLQIHRSDGISERLIADREYEMRIEAEEERDAAIERAKNAEKSEQEECELRLIKISRLYIVQRELEAARVAGEKAEAAAAKMRSSWRRLRSDREFLQKIAGASLHLLGHVSHVDKAMESSDAGTGCKSPAEWAKREDEHNRYLKEADSENAKLHKMLAKLRAENEQLQARVGSMRDGVKRFLVTWRPHLDDSWVGHFEEFLSDSPALPLLDEVRELRDELQAIKTELRKVECARDINMATIDQQRRQIEDIPRVVEKAKSVIATLEDEKTKLRAELQRLMEATKPFTELCKHLDDDWR